MPQDVEFVIEPGDVTDFRADVLLLKYAQNFYGADASVIATLKEFGIALVGPWPKPGDFRVIETKGALPTPIVIFVGVGPLHTLGYDGIQDFGFRAIEVVAGLRSPTNHISMTLHGSGFGLDELESAAAQLAGCRRAIQRFDLPALRRITWVEISKNRVRRVRDSLGGVFHDTNSVAVSGSTEESEIKEVGPFTTPMRFGNKPHIFVAMPFDTEFEDVFYYGIQKPAHESGFLCERVDQETFTGDILEHVKHKIDTASIVVAELTGQNANVYLEVGYAWGKGRRTVLLAKKQEKLLFDVRGQKILLYGTIKELDMILTRELTKLKEVYG